MSGNSAPPTDGRSSQPDPSQPPELADDRRQPPALADGHSAHPEPSQPAKPANGRSGPPEPAEDLSALPELADDPEDPELSALLDSALADFGRPAPAPVAEQSASAATEQLAPQLGDAYSAFEEALRQAAGGSGDGEEVALTSALAALAEEAARADAEHCDEPVAHALSELSRSLAADADADPDTDGDLQQLLRTFAGGVSETPAGGGGDGLEALMPLMQTVMASVLSKDVLYPAMKDVCDRYPAWLERHAATLPEPELDRYRQQQRLMRQVCDAYESSDDEGAGQQRVFALMQQLQALGQPPAELVPQMPAAPQLSAADAQCALM